MNDIIIENDKVIMGPGNLTEINPILPQIKIENYIKKWPVDDNGDKLPKILCYWDDIDQEVKAKTQSMLDIEMEEEIQKQIDSKILNELTTLLLDAKTKTLTFEQFLDTIQAVVI